MRYKEQCAALMEKVVKMLLCMEQSGTNLDTAEVGWLPGYFVLAAHGDKTVSSYTERTMIDPWKARGLLDSAKMNDIETFWPLIECWVCPSRCEPRSIRGAVPGLGL